MQTLTGCCPLVRNMSTKPQKIKIKFYRHFLKSQLCDLYLLCCCGNPHIIIAFFLKWAVVFFSRTFMSIIGGVIAGILGVTGWMGFVFYFLIMAITSVGLAAKAGFSVHLYFGSWNSILLDGFFGGLMVLFISLLKLHGANFPVLTSNCDWTCTFMAYHIVMFYY